MFATVDGILLPDQPHQLFQSGNFNKPQAAILGSVLDEWDFNAGFVSIDQGRHERYSIIRRH